MNDLINLFDKNENLIKIKEEYDQILNFMNNLKDSQTIICPISENLAYFEAEIENPKKCKIYIGENYFLDKSTSKAIKILYNRKTKIDNLLDDVTTQINNSKKETNSINANIKKLSDDTFEICEALEDNDNPVLKSSVKIEIHEKQNIENKLKNLKNSKINKIVTNVDFCEQESQELQSINIQYTKPLQDQLNEDNNSRSLFYLNEE